MNPNEGKLQNSAGEKNEKVNFLLEVNKDALKEVGAENLTNIELFHLKKAVEESLRQNQELENTRREGYHYSQTLPFAEPWIQFLLYYGIDIRNLPRKEINGKVVSLSEDEPLREHIKERLRKAREEAHLL